MKASWVISMTFASAQLYLRDIEVIRGLRICGNRPAVQIWDVSLFSPSNLFHDIHLGLLVFSIYIAVSCSIDCHDCLLYNHHCHYLEEKYSENENINYEKSSINSIETIDHHRLRDHL